MIGEIETLNACTLEIPWHVKAIFVLKKEDHESTKHGV